LVAVGRASTGGLGHCHVVVELVEVVRAAAVGGAEGLARCQRKPAQGPSVVVAGIADEGHQRRGVHRALWQSSRNPGPARTDLRPAPIVKRCKTPGRLVDPGPAPRRNPAPQAGAVGCPVFGQAARQPDGAIGGILLPVAIVVELLVADGFARHVAGRDRLVFGVVALSGPLVKAVLQRRAWRRWG